MIFDPCSIGMYILLAFGTSTVNPGLVGSLWQTKQPFD
jgi:hypothetical protein